MKKENDSSVSKADKAQAQLLEQTSSQ